ncbi:MAG: lactate dehydrogenase [Bacteroidetes bacterium]|nr:MAG: lactate dehydrogenase [Bacteroidota bacterium]
MKKTLYVDSETLQRFTTDVFAGAGVPKEEAKMCAEVLIAADKRGIDSHGINRLVPIYYNRIKEGILNPITHIEVVKEGPATAVLDGHDGMGHVIAQRAMQMAIDKARIYGLGMVAVRNSSHYGIAGYYGLMAEQQGMIGISGTNARPSIAPTFGVENMLGTNPLSFVMPSDEAFPFFLDCATSVIQRGKIEYYARQGKDIPDGVVIGHDGKTLTRSQEIVEAFSRGAAALAPLGGVGEDNGGYKGYGYATVVEILSAALQGGAFLQMLTGMRDGKKVPYNLGHFFMAINIASFTDLEEFKKSTGDILRGLRESKVAPGSERIFTAGEKEYLVALEREKSGIPVNETLQKEIKQLIGELELKGYDELLRKIEG